MVLLPYLSVKVGMPAEGILVRLGMESYLSRQTNTKVWVHYHSEDRQVLTVIRSWRGLDAWFVVEANSALSTVVS